MSPFQRKGSAPVLALNSFLWSFKPPRQKKYILILTKMQATYSYGKIFLTGRRDNIFNRSQDTSVMSNHISCGCRIVVSEGRSPKTLLCNGRPCTGCVPAFSSPLSLYHFHIVIIVIKETEPKIALFLLLFAACSFVYIRRYVHLKD